MGMGKGKTAHDAERTSDPFPKGWQNAEAHVKLAQSYQERGEMEKAITEYLLAGDILSQNGLYPQALAIYKEILKQSPLLEEVELKVAEIYGKMESWENAYSQYGRVLQIYNKQGREDKAQELMVLMAELSMKMIGAKEKVQPPPRPDELRSSEPEGAKVSATNVPRDHPSDKEERKEAFDLGATLAANQLVEAKAFSKLTREKIYGFEEIVKELKKAKISSSIYPDFNYHMGAACREMGFIDEAIAQFQIALKKGQKPCEAAHLLGCCFREKGLWNDARQWLERALKVKGISQEKIRKIKDDLALIAAESSRKRSAS